MSSAKFWTWLIITFNICLMIWSYAELNKFYSNWWLNWLLGHTQIVFIASFFLILLVNKGGGILSLFGRIFK